mgnify:CR=1 FL=1
MMMATASPDPLTGSLEISVTTVSYGGLYAPLGYCLAAWIQKPDGTHVKDLVVAGYYYWFYLYKWMSASGGDIDDVTEATRHGHGATSSTRDMTNETGDAVQPGTYEFWIEFTEHNGQGVYTSGAITLDGSSSVQADGQETDEFTNFSAVYTP